MENILDKIPVIKKDAQVTITLGTQIITELQSILSFHLQGHEESEITEIKKQIVAGEKVPEWAQHSSTLTRLLKGVLESAISAGNVDYRELKDLIGESI